MRAFLSGASLLLIGVLIGVLVGPDLRGVVTGDPSVPVSSRSALAAGDAGALPTTSAAAAALRDALTETETETAAGGPASTPASVAAVDPTSGATLTPTPTAGGPAGALAAGRARGPAGVPSDVSGVDTSRVPVPVLAPPVPGLPVVVGLGDSITYNSNSWFRQLCAAGTVLRNCVDAGVRGNTTAQMLSRLDADVLRHRPSLVIVMGGSNDLRQRVPTDVTIAQLAEILARVKSAGAYGVIATITPRDRHGREALALNAAIRDYATRRGLPLLDVYPAVGRPDGTWQPGLSIDGTHPTAIGSARMTEFAAQQLPVLIGPRLLLSSARTAAGS